MLPLILVCVVITLAVVILSRYLFPDRFSIEEEMLIAGVSLFAGCSIVVFLSVAAYRDYDVLNGSVTSKHMAIVPCSHSYPCHCRSTKNGTSCDTCYMHPFDEDWIVNTTVGSVDINRVDLQGLIEPPRYASVKIGEPASLTESVTNYVKGSPDSLFHTKNTKLETVKYKNQLPKYPVPYDYYRYQRVVTLGIDYPQKDKLNDLLNDKLKTLGKEKQVNIIFVLTSKMDKNFKTVLENSWLGGKKNDVVIVADTSDYPKIDWVDGFTFGKSLNNELLIVSLKEDLKDLNNLDDVVGITNVITTDVMKYYHRQPMSKFEYLKADFEPSWLGLLIGSMFYAIIISGMLVFAYKENIFD